METRTDRPRLKHVMIATAMGWYQVRNAWRAYFRGLNEERKAQVRKQQRGW